MRRTGPVWRRPLQVGIAVLVVLTAMVILPAPRDALAAYAEQVLYRFCSQTNCVDGKNPAAALIMDGGGNLYGTTVSGGANNGGAVFKLTPIATGWTYNVLYSFCSKALCADGGTPHAGLIMDGTGNLYGTTTGGGPNQSTSGLVFKLVPSGNGWTETVLYSFCTQSNCTDGAQPYGTLIMDAAGNLYGTTAAGGNRNSACSANGCGTVFELSPTVSGWTEKVLYRFCSQSNCADGVQPLAGVAMDGVGNLYGTTFSGGSTAGVIFELMPSGSSWTEKLLHAFGSSASDGDSPQANLIIDGAGNLYGTTFNGGGSGFGTCAGSCGAVFELSSTDSTWSENTLHGFGDGDGAFPAAGVIMDGAGHLYGSTSGGGSGAHVCFLDGGNYGCGVAFQLAFTGTSWTETVLYSFCPQSNCVDGAEPRAGLIMDGAGNLYGTTYQGGNSSNAGVVFALGSSNTLSVSLNGSGGGKVTSSPTGIDCGSTCSAKFNAGTQVTLTASPAAAWGLTGWGGACGGIGGCTVTLNANTSVSATFTTLFTAAQPPVVTSPSDIPVLPAVIGPLPQ
jgi:uncharacterized repeat protein (TIGR03803 family)